MTFLKYASRRRGGGFLFAAIIFWFANAQGVVFTSQLVTNLPGVGVGAGDSTPSEGAAVGGYFYFAATDGLNGATGRELWRTDGTPGGTTLVKDIYPGAADSSPESIVAAGTNLFFTADDGVHGRQLWKSDGTVNGTFSITALTNGEEVAEIFPMGNGACFIANFGFFSQDYLYRTDGTQAGTFPLTGPGGAVTTSPLGGFDVSGTDIAILSLDSTFGFVTNTIWRFTGAYMAYPVTIQHQALALPAIVGTNCYFITASNYTVIDSISTNHFVLQILNRASMLVNNGPVQRVDSTPGGKTSSFNSVTVVNSRLFYSYNWEDQYLEPFTGPWKSVAQSGLPSSILPDGSGSREIIGTIGANIYFLDGNTIISRTDGTSAGISVLNLAPFNFDPYSYQQVGSRFFFAGGTPHSVNGLGVTDLTAGGTIEITNAAPGTNGYVQGFMGVLGNLAIYHAINDQIGDEPYRTDGTSNGTFLLKDIAVGGYTAPPSEAVAVSGQFFFTMTNSTIGTELWHSDGTVAGTAPVKDIRGGVGSSWPSNLTAWNGLLYFAANNGTNGSELWRSDGTAAGTYMVKDIRLGAGGSNPSQLTPAGTQLYFVADDGTHGAELWSSDGTSNGTVLVQDIQPGINPAHIHDMSAGGNEVHFFAGTNASSTQLWVSSPSLGTQFLKDFGGYQPRDFTPYHSKFYFVFTYNLFGMTIAVLGQTDDTPDGTVFLIQGGSDLSTANGALFANSDTSLVVGDGNVMTIVTNLPNTIAQLTPFGSFMYFTSGSQLWSSDGTTNGTHPVGNFSPAAPSLANFTQFQGSLVFSATTPLLGRELWATALGQVPAMIEDLSPFGGNDNVQFVCAATNQIFYIAKPAGQSAWQLRTLHLQTLLPPPTGAFGGTPWPVPGRIEAENFDRGGDGVAYHDTTADNEGGQYRLLDGVDLQGCNDTNGGYCVFQTRPGEWLDYTVNAAVSGIYELDIRMTTAAVDTGYFHFEVDGTIVDSEVAVNNGAPGGWSTIVTSIPFNAGTHVLRIVFDNASSAGDVGVYNWFNLSLQQTNLPPTVSVTFPPAGGILATDKPVTLQAQVVDLTAWNAPTVEFFMDGQSVGITNYPHGVSWLPTPGAHTVYAIATDSFGATGISSNVVFYVGQPYLANGSFWRINVFGTNLPNAWRLLSYNDSSWPRLRAPFGFGYPSQTLILSNYLGAPIPTFYFRQTFSNNLSSFNSASITLTRDDAAVIWINGQQLARLNLPQTGSVIFTNLALTNVNNSISQTNAAQDVIVVPTSMLVDGTNIIAVEVHQGLPSIHDNFDLRFDLTFSTFTYASLKITTATNGVTVQWPDSLPGWNLEHSTDLKSWNPVGGTPVDTNGLFNLLFNPHSAQKDFFRLHQSSGP